MFRNNKRTFGVIFFLLIASVYAVEAAASSKPISKKEMSHETDTQGGAFFVEYLWMRSTNSSLVFASQAKIDEVPGSFQNRVVNNTMVSPDRRWSSGFRVGSSYLTTDQNWDISADWTYYYNKSLNDRTMPAVWVALNNQNTEEGFVPYWAVATKEANINYRLARYQDLQGVWQLNYNMMDLEMGRSIELTHRLIMRSHFGLQSGWIHQKIAVLYSRSFEDRIPATDIYVDQLTNANNNFWGIGPRVGVEGELNLGEGFFLSGKVAGSLLTGRTTVRRVQSSDLQGGGEFLRSYNISSRINQYSPGALASFGVSWERNLTDTSKVYFRAAWESNFWWGQFKFNMPELGQALTDYPDDLYLDYPQMSGALYIEGVSVKMAFDF